MTDILDIVSRIENTIYFTEDTNVNDLLRDAVDEIERLREWNAEIALNARHFAEALGHVDACIVCGQIDQARKAIRAALEGKHD